MNSQNIIKCVGIIFCTVSLNSYAQLPHCEKKYTSLFEKKICQDEKLKDLTQQVREKYLATQLMSNAPLVLLQRSQEDWLNYVKNCKSRQCIQQQFEQRLDDLTFTISMNQSLTQHFIRYNQHKTNEQMVTLQLQQLDKNKIKIEAMQYRNPNNSDQHKIGRLRSYTTIDLAEPITDLETKCIYTLVKSNHILEFKTEDAKCKRFEGIYKLYD